MIEVSLSQGAVALIDDEDFPLIQNHTWWAYRRRLSSHADYAFTTIKKRTVFMHRRIMSAARGQVVDHANGDGLDNRRANLRLCTVSQNGANRHAVPIGEAGFRGVHRSSKPGRPYRVRIIANRIRYYGGYFDCAIEAAKMADALALKHFGEFASLNFPEGYPLHGDVHKSQSASPQTELRLLSEQEDRS